MNGHLQSGVYNNSFVIVDVDELASLRHTLNLISDLPIEAFDHPHLELSDHCMRGECGTCWKFIKSFKVVKLAIDLPSQIMTIKVVNSTIL
jgi:hypothetical protein